MKTCIVLFVLVTLTTYCRGRTRWRMIEYDVDVDKTNAYKDCRRECLVACKESGACNDPETICREGCQHLLTSRLAPQPDEPKRPFEVADLWKLFEAK